MAKLDHEQWPLQKEADELLDSVEKQKTRGVKYPCPYVDLRKFAPAWCATFADKPDDADSDNEPSETARHLGRALGVRMSHEKRHLTVVQWMAAYDRYAVAAAVAGCYTYDALLKHKDNTMRLAEECRTKGKPTALALVYDETLRRDCDNKQYSGLPDFDPNKALRTLSRELVEKAETALEANRRSGSDKGKGKGHEKGHEKGKGQSSKGYGKHNDDREKRKLPWNRSYSSWADKDDNGAKHQRRW